MIVPSNERSSRILISPEAAVNRSLCFSILLEKNHIKIPLTTPVVFLLTHLILVKKFI